MAAVPLPPTLPLLDPMAASAVHFNVSATEADRARAAASLAAVNSRAQEVRVIEQDAVSKNAALRAHTADMTHTNAVTHAARAALELERSSVSLINTHSQFRAAEELYTATIAKRNQAEAQLLNQSQETFAMRERYAAAEMDRNNIAIGARVEKERALASEAGIHAAQHYELQAGKAAMEAAKAAAAMRVRLSESDAIVQEIEAKRSAAATTAAAASVAARDALAREQEANNALAAITLEAETARASVAQIRADANLAEEAARVKAAGHAAAKAGVGEASQHHFAQTSRLADISSKFIETEAVALRAETDLEAAVTKETFAQKDLEHSLLEQDQARKSELLASDALSHANATLAASEELLRRAGSSEAVERVNRLHATRIAAEEETKMLHEGEHLAFVSTTESVARVTEATAAATAASAAENLLRTPVPGILSPRGRLISAPHLSPVTPPLFY